MIDNMILVSKFNVELNFLLVQGPADCEFYGDLEYQFNYIIILNHISDKVQTYWL